MYDIAGASRSSEEGQKRKAKGRDEIQSRPSCPIFWSHSGELGVPIPLNYRRYINGDGCFLGWKIVVLYSLCAILSFFAIMEICCWGSEYIVIGKNATAEFSVTMDPLWSRVEVWRFTAHDYRYLHEAHYWIWAYYRGGVLYVRPGFPSKSWTLLFIGHEEWSLRGTLCESHDWLNLPGTIQLAALALALGLVARALARRRLRKNGTQKTGQL